jgi:hypothetical protein
MAVKKRIVAPVPDEKSKPKMAIDEGRMSPPPVPPAPTSPLEIKSRSKEQYTRVEDIDPSLAKLLLEANVRNRPISGAHVRSLARDMASGNWRLTHQGIALDRDGRLVDGQHRLSAIVESNTTQKLAVTYNVDPESFHSVDVGIQPRSIAQIVGLVRGTKYATAVTAASKVLWHVLEENHDQPIRLKWTESEVSSMLDKFETDLVWVCERVCNVKMLKQAPVIAALGYAAPVARESVADLIEKLKYRANMTKTQAACWKALERLGTVSTHDRRLDMTTLVLKVIMHHLKGENDLQSISVRSDAHLDQPVYGFFRARRKKLGLVT